MDRKIDINKADANEFEQIDGIDGETARRIIEFRKKSGNFKKMADLDNVPGLDGSQLHHLKSQGFLESAQVSYSSKCDCSSADNVPSEGLDSQQMADSISRTTKLSAACSEESIDIDRIEELDRFFQKHGIRKQKLRETVG